MAPLLHASAWALLLSARQEPGERASDFGRRRPRRQGMSRYGRRHTGGARALGRAWARMGAATGNRVAGG
ncbi:unnamed protein product [Urochloa humidicola]